MLVKLGSFSTDKAVLVHALNNTVNVVRGVANVENLEQETMKLVKIIVLQF